MVIKLQVRQIETLDTTLREGSQAKGIYFTVQDRIKIILKLDEIGVHIIEAGWPGANPVDSEVFRAIKDYRLLNAKIAAFGSTRRKNVKVTEDKSLNDIIKADVELATLFGKSWDLHVKYVLRTTLEENLRIIAESIEYLREHGIEVLFDAEHFFDGYKDNPDYALEVLKTAAEAKARTLVLADTNGGLLPHESYEIVKNIVSKFKNAQIGLHLHNDSGNAVANTIMGVLAGATHAQVTVNGLGERVGNADLCQVIPNLELKLGIKTLKTAGFPSEGLKKLVELSRTVYDSLGIEANPYQPYVGENAFAHKAGVHADAVIKISRAYEHIEPSAVGNQRTFAVSELSGRANIIAKAKNELGISLEKSDSRLLSALNEIKELETRGYSFDEAYATALLILLRHLGLYEEFFEVIEWRTVSEGHNLTAKAWSWIKLRAQGKEIIEAGEGVGPVHASDIALRKALIKAYPEIDRVKLINYKVILPGIAKHTASEVRVDITFTDGKRVWGTTATSPNIIDASIKALADGLSYFLQLERNKSLKQKAVN